MAERRLLFAEYQAQQGGLATPGLSDNRDKFSTLNVEINSVENPPYGAPVRVLHRNIIDANNGFRHQLFLEPGMHLAVERVHAQIDKEKQECNPENIRDDGVHPH